jgi:hypothetical protein
MKQRDGKMSWRTPIIDVTTGKVKGLSNLDLVERFARGFERGASNRMEIKRDGNETIIVGYGHAVYARRKPNGTIILYDGWYGYSPTTSTHLNMIRPYAEVVNKRKPSW